MSKQNGPLDWLKQKLDSMPPGNKNGKNYYLLILLLAGVLFMLIGSIWKNDTADQQATVVSADQNTVSEEVETFAKKDSNKNDEMKQLEDQYENQLKEALEGIVGVSHVSVVVHVGSTEQKVFEKNTILRNQTTSEEDKEGGTRQIEDQSQEEELVLINEGEKDTPVVKEIRKPEIKGVLIVAGGAENIQVKKWIIEAVTRLLDVPSHKVAVIPKKSKGDS
ncbi:stage III sporulation protein AG [Bacillus sp. FJAT-50079]|uniref:stage III sporulation protein AG n=1 Tax=Bacillus sp. FJAT-50079 TaxID=2833577 RepID=UPI001BCA5931|nr:stage III sporulation protein AG [Bacillus sp. FJAT-50079]MBS4209638.1 stage III sporulation protein AG [Bacillus sp. FJAT-50079]